MSKIPTLRLELLLLLLLKRNQRAFLSGDRRSTTFSVADPGHLVRGRFIHFTFSVATPTNNRLKVASTKQQL